MKRLKVKIKGSSEGGQDGQSSVLDNARNVCLLVSNLGSGALGVPGLQAAGHIALQIIDLIKKIKDNKADCEQLVTRIVQLMSPIGDTLKAQNAKDIDLRLQEDLKRFERDLADVHDILQRQVKRNMFSKTKNANVDAHDILKCKDLIDQGFKRFEVYTSIALRMDITHLRQDFDEILSQQVKNSLDIALPPSQPIAPEIFFGRDDLISDMVSLILKNTQTRIALLGGGGMGKTSTALHILHHQDVAARYTSHRYFIGCDAVTSADALVELILQVLQVPQVAEEAAVTVLHRALLAAPSTLLLLDNFETVWNLYSSRARVVDLLQKIANANLVSLMITMRGTAPPTGIIWTHFDSLLPLSPEAAKRAFLAINPLSSDGVGGNGSSLETLLEEMDYIPLAIHLLAQVTIGFSSSYALKCWRQEKTAMLHTHEGQPDRLENIEVSISLSLDTLDITSNPDAIQLLGALCQLPDGLFHWEERLALIGGRFKNVFHLFHLLHKVALVFIEGHKLKVMSPIRHYINYHHPADSHHIKCVENYFWTLVDTHATQPISPTFIHAKDTLELDMGNIRSLVINAIKNDISLEIVDVVLKISGFLCQTRPSSDLLYEVLPLVKKIGLPVKEAQVYQSLGDILRMQDKHSAASDALKEAHKKSLAIGNVLGTAQCSKSMGTSLHMQNRYSEASDTLKEAKNQFLHIGDALGAAQCSRGLGDILRMQCKFPEAKEILSEAHKQFLKIGNDSGAAQCSQSLGHTFYMQSKYTEAHEALSTAHQQFHTIGDVRNAASCSKSLGNILYMQNEYAEASDTVKGAYKIFLEIGDVLGAAQCSQSLGDILYMQGKDTEAIEALEKAQKQFLEIGYVLGTAQCSQSLGKILCMQNKYTEACDVLKETKNQFLEIGDVPGIAQCLRSLGIILNIQNKYTEASDSLSEACKLFLQIGSVCDAVQCSQMLSHISDMQNIYTEAHMLYSLQPIS